jgi:hypothetical protein
MVCNASLRRQGHDFVNWPTLGFVSLTIFTHTVAHAAERERPGDGLERLDADRNADHVSAASS